MCRKGNEFAQGQQKFLISQSSTTIVTTHIPTAPNINQKRKGKIIRNYSSSYVGESLYRRTRHDVHRVS